MAVKSTGAVTWKKHEIESLIFNTGYNAFASLQNKVKKLEERIAALEGKN